MIHVNTTTDWASSVFSRISAKCSWFVFLPELQMKTVTPDRGTTLNISTTQVKGCKVCTVAGGSRKCTTSLLLKDNKRVQVEFDCSRPQDVFSVEVVQNIGKNATVFLSESKRCYWHSLRIGWLIYFTSHLLISLRRMYHKVVQQPHHPGRVRLASFAGLCPQVHLEPESLSAESVQNRLHQRWPETDKCIGEMSRQTQLHHPCLTVFRGRGRRDILQNGAYQQCSDTESRQLCCGGTSRAEAPKWPVSCVCRGGNQMWVGLNSYVWMCSLSPVSNILIWLLFVSFFSHSSCKNHPDSTKRDLVRRVALSKLSGQFSWRRRDGVVLSGPGQTKGDCWALKSYTAAL